jgi:hypothetical protein
VDLDLAGCTPDAVVCDDTGPEPAWWFGLLELGAGAVALMAVGLLLVLALRRASRPKRVTSRVWIDAHGDVVRRET